MNDVALTPLLLTKTQVIAYACGGSEARYKLWKRNGKLPERVSGTALYNRHEVELAVSAIISQSGAKVRKEELSPLQRFMRKRDAKRNNTGS